MFRVTSPSAMNEAFARAFNSRRLDNLLSLYEPGAVHKSDASDAVQTGKERISAELRHLLEAPGTMVSKNNFCIESEDLALLRADWAVVGDDGTIHAAGSSAEVVRRQPDGSWLYLIDHANGAGRPRLA